MPDTFSMRLDVNDDGVAILHVSGRFDIDQWREARQSIVAKLNEIAASANTPPPLIADLRESPLPIADWLNTFSGVISHQIENPVAVGPVAFLAGDDAMQTVAHRLYQEVGKLQGSPPVRVKWFTDFEAAYDWVTSAHLE